jgi:unsaturated rhamnogalacturonyl hydrolase
MKEWAEWLMAPDGLPKTEEGGFQHIVYNDENPGEMWDDTLMMSVLPLARFGLLLIAPIMSRRPSASSSSISNICSIPRPACGSMGGTSAGGIFCRALWARGNCWMTIAIPKSSNAGSAAGDAFRTFLVDTLAAQVKTLAATQADNGLWHTLVMDPTSSGGFGHGGLCLWHPEGGASGPAACGL